MALRQTAGFVESLPCLIVLDWDVPDFSILGRQQKTPAVIIPHRRSQAPLHALIENTGIKVDGEWNARKCHDIIADRRACTVISQRKNARSSNAFTTGADARNKDQSSSKELGRALATIEWLPP